VSVCLSPGSAPLCACSHTGPRALGVPTGVAWEAGAVPPSAAPDITPHEGQRRCARGRLGAGGEAARHLAVERLCHTPPARTRATCGTRRCCGGFRSQHAFARHARVLGQEVGLGVRVLGPLTADTAEAGGSGIMSYRRYKLHAWPLNVAKGLEEQTHRNPRRARVHS
jgi:hypothetical protein